MKKKSERKRGREGDVVKRGDKAGRVHWIGIGKVESFYFMFLRE